MARAAEPTSVVLDEPDCVAAGGAILTQQAWILSFFKSLVLAVSASLTLELSAIKIAKVLSFNVVKSSSELNSDCFVIVLDFAHPLLPPAKLEFINFPNAKSVLQSPSVYMAAKTLADGSVFKVAVVKVTALSVPYVTCAVPASPPLVSVRLQLNSCELPKAVFKVSANVVSPMSHIFETIDLRPSSFDSRLI